MQIMWESWGFVVLLVGHLLMMLLAGGGPVACLLLEWSCNGTVGRDANHSVAKRLARNCIAYLIVGSLLGLAMIWVANATGQRDYAYVFERFYDRVWWGAWELVTYTVAMLAYWLAWDRLQKSNPGKWVHRCIAVLAVTNLLYHFPPLLTVMVDAMNSATINSDSAGVASAERITSSEYRTLIFQTPVLAKTLHFVFASLAVAGGWLMAHCSPEPDIEEDQTDASEDSIVAMVTGPPRVGSVLATIALVFQLLIGLWLVVLATPSEQAAVMGRDGLATACLLIGVLLSLVALNQSAAVAMGEGRFWQCRSAAGLIGVAVVLMIVMTAKLSGLV